MLDEKNLLVYFAKRQKMRQRGNEAWWYHRKRHSEREWGEEDMVESFREHGKAMNACT